ncbi:MULTISPECIES: hypothetical protein [Anoxynatronum]|uniref:Uncharacterized protein n=2 Tax=Anoxynatronum TaxID=210622 RepID=A0AA45WX05_9CLOT|nr:hypothetical protein [Anoxynatronum buryatiense]SMP61423.1 hypothetical protein SAMN06296020_10944 [Anoxynatronum buryatiense]
MEQRERIKLKQQIQQINSSLSEGDAQKIMELLEKEVQKVERKMMITLEIKEMLEDWLEEEYEEDDGDRVIH